MFILENYSNHKIVAVFSDRARADAWLGAMAQEYNCGICREWHEDIYDVYDIGPRVFCLYEVDNMVIEPEIAWDPVFRV